MNFDSKTRLLKSEQNLKKQLADLKGFIYAN